jgi:hypothetical protein
MGVSSSVYGSGLLGLARRWCRPRMRAPGAAVAVPRPSRFSPAASPAPVRGGGIVDHAGTGTDPPRSSGHGCVRCVQGEAVEAMRGEVGRRSGRAALGKVGRRSSQSSIMNGKEEAVGRRVERVFARLAAVHQRLFSPPGPTHRQLTSKQGRLQPSPTCQQVTVKAMIRRQPSV